MRTPITLLKRLHRSRYPKIQQRLFTSAQSQTVCNWFCPELERKYQDGARFYEVDIHGENKLLPSVTSVLNMFDHILEKNTRKSKTHPTSITTQAVRIEILYMGM